MDLIPTTTVWASVCATKAATSPTVPAFPESNAVPIPSFPLQDPASAMPVSPITAEYVPGAPKAPSGAHLLISASSYADKTQLTLQLPRPVSAIKDTASSADPVKFALLTTSSPTDTASPVQLTQLTTLNLRPAAVSPVSLLTSGVSVQENAELMRSTMPQAKPAVAFKVWEE